MVGILVEPIPFANLTTMLHRWYPCIPDTGSKARLVVARVRRRRARWRAGDSGWVQPGEIIEYVVEYEFAEDGLGRGLTVNGCDV